MSLINSGFHSKALLSIAYISLQISDFRFWIVGIASLYPLINRAEFLKSKIYNPNSCMITVMI